MKKYEYIRAPKSCDLNFYGNLGWALVATVPNAKYLDDLDFIFMREKKESEGD